MTNRKPDPWTVNTGIARPDPELVRAFAAFETGQLADAAEDVGVIVGLRREAGTAEVCGVAITVWTNPGDLLFPLKSADVVTDGDVVVMDGGGYVAAALCGEIYAGALAQRGCRAMIVDGAIRDVGGIDAAGVSAYARGTAPGKQTIAGPGAINVPIECAGVRVEPGDIIRADATGIVVIPRERAEVILEAANEVIAIEEGWVAGVRGAGIGQALGLDGLIERGRPR